MSTIQNELLTNFNGIFIRPFESTKDDIEQLTKLLNISYKQLADLGFNYMATHQDSTVTRRRIKNAVCLIALKDSEIIGSITYYSPKNNTGCHWYDKDNVAKIGQFGVNPSFQSKGVGRELLELVEKLATKDKAEELALDTAEGASHLIQYYGKKGYRFIEYVNWNHTNYRSVVLSKSLVK
ncbi:GNAT family N-acetyltransferase [Bacillus sp. B1-b2]|uniref:GNAT family N-acetyltransferase n=1 Tax=Bacillus sp. B1-b2 TaxID=2653201 RepID=UPI001261C9E0|nr:GNAT family N-acetyltransferase [Bacillus sp. B1-b2]KAB7672051.1 GNAT family N-acetyltransferase [Bacillus sp. B1-b2]